MPFNPDSFFLRNFVLSSVLYNFITVIYKQKTSEGLRERKSRRIEGRKVHILVLVSACNRDTRSILLYHN